MQSKIKSKDIGRWIFKAAFLLCISGLNHSLNFARAQYITGPTSMSLGGAGVAGLSSADSVFINPASVSRSTSFEVDLLYQDGYIQNTDHKSLFGFLVADNSEGVLFPGAIGYITGSRLYSGYFSQDQMWHITIGRRVTQYLRLGFNFIYLDSEISGFKNFKQLTGSVGAIYDFNNQLSLGFSAEHLGEVDDEIPVPLKLAPHLRIGVRYQPLELFSFYLDSSRRQSENPEDKGALHFGIESLTNAFTVLRVGMRWDDYLGYNYFTGGLGFDGPRLKINYSLQKAIKGPDGALHGVDFRVSF